MGQVRKFQVGDIVKWGSSISNNREEIVEIDGRGYIRGRYICEYGSKGGISAHFLSPDQYTLIKTYNEWDD